MLIEGVNKVSIIIPALNEGSSLGETLSTLTNNKWVSQIIVVDGGSTDETLSIAGQANVKLLVSDKGSRAHQMNLGAAAATGDLLLFLHADTRVPQQALRKMVQTMQKYPDSPGGGFLRFFDCFSPFLKMTCLFALWRCYFKRIFYGDQAIFVRKAAFESVGGYDESLPYGEEVALCTALKKHGTMRIVLSPIVSSARRFEKLGAIRQTFIDKKLGRELIDLHQE